MLDTFEVLTTSGVVLWSRTYVPVGANVINSLIRDVFIEEKIVPQSDDAGSKPTYRKEGYTLKWTTSKDLGLIFVVSFDTPFNPCIVASISSLPLPQLKRARE
jgi:signal recognition particle receptor subunit alpha